MAHESGKQKLYDWYRLCAASLEHLPCELTTRQWGILLHVYLMDSAHTVRSLAYTFNISKPSVCRALDTLSTWGLLKRRKDKEDARSIIVSKTMKGIAFLNQFSDILDTYYAGEKTGVTHIRA